MIRTFKDIFKCETCWVYNIIRTQKVLNSYEWFLENHKYQVLTAIHQASEKYFKYKLFEKYDLDSNRDFRIYINMFDKDKYTSLNNLRITHNLYNLFLEVKDLLDDDIILYYSAINDIIYNCYIDLRYPNIKDNSIDDKVDKKFMNKLLKYLNVLYSKTGCSGLQDTKEFFKELKETKKAKEYYKDIFTSADDKSNEVKNKSLDLMSSF